MGKEKNVLVIGGSYFAGRIFTMLALKDGYHVTVINRGSYSLKETGNVTEHICDRRDYCKLQKLPLKKEYDAVVDFCAYEPGDIAKMFAYLPCGFGKYIYISTADVSVSSAGVRNEKSPLLTQKPSDPVGLYAYKKMLLEKELAESAINKACTYTILRPVFIYGPYNYAPREGWYIQKIISGEAIPHPTDADGKFQMIYVKDVARAILLCIEKPQADNQNYLLSAPEEMTYDRYLKVLREVSDREVKTVPVTVAEVIKRKIPLPFPLTERESELFDGQKIVSDLGFEYGDQKESMQLTFNAFRSVFE